MKNILKTGFVLSGIFLVLSLTVRGGDLVLPTPGRAGGMALADALNARKTVRSYQKQTLALQQIADLLWHANGINRPDGRRTAPSAINRQEISIYVLTADGGWYWDPAKNTLERRTGKDVRSGAGFFDAPLYLVLAADLNRAASPHFADIDCGYVSQNVYLFCAANGFGTCAIGSFDRPRNAQNFECMVKELKLRPEEKVLLTHSIGIPR